MLPSEGVAILDLSAYQYDREVLAAAGYLLIDVGKVARSRGYHESLNWTLGALATILQDVLKGLPPVRAMQFDIGAAPEKELFDVLNRIACANGQYVDFDSEAGQAVLDLLAQPFQAESRRRGEGTVLQ